MRSSGRRCGDRPSRGRGRAVVAIDGLPIGRRAGSFPVLELVDLVETEHGLRPVARVIDELAIRAPDGEDIERLRPLFELGERYAAAATAFVGARARAIAAVDDVQAARCDRSWRAAAARALGAADELDAVVLALRGLVGATWRWPARGQGPADAAAVAAVAITRAVRDNAFDAWPVAAMRLRTEDRPDVGRCWPWSQFAFWGWEYGLQGRSWIDAWCAGDVHHLMQLFPDATLAAAAGLASPDAARKRRRRWRGE